MHSFSFPSSPAAALALGVLLAPMLSAQQAPDITNLSTAATARGVVHRDHPGDGNLWLHGDDWKAALDGQRFLFVPFLGSDAPQNWPVSVALRAARTGSTRLPLANGALEEHGDEVRIDRGSLIEVYHLAPNGIEQSFVFPERPAAGALAVDLTLATELAVTIASDGSTQCRNERGGVDIDSAVAIDARGRRAPCTTTLVAGTLTWTVPAAFVAAATFPLTIDPLYLVYNAYPLQPYSQRLPDVAYVGTYGGMYATVFEQVFSATDTDLVCSFQSPDAIFHQVDYLDLTTTSWITPQIASNAPASQFVCVARTRVVVAGQTFYTVYSRQIDFSWIGPAPLFVFPPPQTLSASGLQVGSPDIGGNPTAAAGSPGRYCVIWDDNGLLMHNFVMTNGVVAFATGNVVPFTSLFPIRRPAIAKSCGSNAPNEQEWIAVYEQEVTATNRDIWGTRIRVDGTITDAHFPIHVAADDDGTPEVSSLTDDWNGSNAWMVVWRRNVPGTPPFTLPHGDLYGAAFHDSTSLTGLVDLTSLLGLVTARDQVNPCVETDGIRFAVGYSESSLIGSSDLVPWLATLHQGAGGALVVTAYPEAGNAYSGPDDHMQITAEHSGGTAGPRYASAWDVTAPPPQPSAVLGAFYRGHVDAPPSSYFAQALPGCGPMVLSASGLPALGQTITFSLTGGQGIPLLLLGDSIPPVPLCAACNLGVDPSGALLATSSYSLTIPPDTALEAYQFGVQGIDFLAPGGCTTPVIATLTNEIIVLVL